VLPNLIGGHRTLPDGIEKKRPLKGKGVTAYWRVGGKETSGHARKSIFLRQKKIFLDVLKMEKDGFPKVEEQKEQLETQKGER